MQSDRFHPARLAASCAAMTARAIREPWNLLVAGAGAGAAWAIGLPVGAAGVVGAGMFGVAALAGGAIGGNQVGIDSTEPQQPLRPCSAQATLVVILRRYRSDLDDLRQTQSVPALAVTARHAADAARHAETIADRVARAIDRVDDAVSRGDRVAKQMPRSSQVQASVQRMKQRRADLLTKLTDAVEEVGELYTKLLELSTTADLLAVPADEVSAAGQLSDSLDAIREVFAELEMDASATRALL